MLGMGPILWKRIFKECWQDSAREPPVSRRLCQENDPSPYEFPAAQKYYRVLDEINIKLRRAST